MAGRQVKAFVGCRGRGGLGTAHRSHWGRARGRAAGILVKVLYQTRCRIGVEVIEQRPLTHVNLIAFQECRYRDDQRKLLRVATVVVGHGHDGLAVVAHQSNLRRLIEQLRVGFGDIEAAEAPCDAGRVQRTQQECAAQGYP